MNIELTSNLRGTKLKIWESLLTKAGLEADISVEQTVLVWDEQSLVATGSRLGNLLKCIAVESDRQGEGLTATVVTTLRQAAFREGYRHLFLYTKPENKTMFSSLFFYPVAQTNKVLLMENRKNGIFEFLNTLQASNVSGTIGAIVMNCNPFTLGHRYLIETASRECDYLYVFILSEDKSLFSAKDRLEMAKLGTCDLANVMVLPTGPYLISSATFPTYFLKNREKVGRIQCLLDIQIFTKFFAPKFSITRRYVGTEPFSPITHQYNEALKEYLPMHGIEFIELPRLKKLQTPVSASAVRKYLDSRDTESIKKLVPDTTFLYLRTKGLL